MTKPLLVLILALSAAGCSYFGGAKRESDLPKSPSADAYREDVGVSTAWTASVGELPEASGWALNVSVAGGRVYAAGANGRVSAFDAASGKRLWETNLDRTLTAGPTAGAGVVVVGTRNGQALGLAADSGEVLWRSGVTSEVLAAPQVSDDLVVVRSADGRVFGLDPQTGQRKWLFEHTMPALTLRGSSAPLMVPGKVVIVGLDNGRMVALSPQDGKQIWEALVAAPKGLTELERMVDVDAAPVLYRTDVYAASYQGRLVGIDGLTGRPRWDREFSTYSGLAVDASRVYASSADNRVWAVDRVSGAAVWRNDELRGLRLTGPALFKDYVVVGDNEGYLNWLAARDGKLVRRQRIGGGFVAAPRSQGDALYLLTSQGLTVLR